MTRSDLSPRRRQIHDAWWHMLWRNGNPSTSAIAANLGISLPSVSAPLRDLRNMGLLPERQTGSCLVPQEWLEEGFVEQYPLAIELREGTEELSQVGEGKEVEKIRVEAVQEEALPLVLLGRLQKRKDQVLSLEELADELDVSPRRVREAAADLETTGYNVFIESGHIGLTRQDEPSDETAIAVDGKCIRFGAISDTHLCSKQERLDVLNSLYDWYAEERIKDVYLAGNMIEGESRFNVREVHTFGLDAQVNYFIDKFPQREGIITHFIAGDDHEGWYQQREGISIGRYIQTMAQQQGRDDLHYLGYMEHDIAFKNNAGEFIMRVAHPGGGSAYALSYKPQKLVESYQGGEKPAVLLIGHYHKMEYLPAVRNVRVFQLGCTVDQSVWARKKSLDYQLGGWLIELVQCERTGACIGCKAEDRTYFDRAFYRQWEDAA